MDNDSLGYIHALLPEVFDQGTPADNIDAFDMHSVLDSTESAHYESISAKTILISSNK